MAFPAGKSDVGPRPGAAGQRIALEHVGTAALLALPGALVVYFSFNAGGFFPGTSAFAALILAQVLAVRTVLADDPFAGFSRPLAVAALGLSAYALWTLASGLWSDAPARALIEFDRALLYLLAMILFGSLPRTEARVRWMLRGLTAATVGVCVAGLASRTLPELVSAAPTFQNSRLSYPLTYWNALGLLAAFALLGCFHFASRVREPVAVRVLGASAVPAVATTLLLTFSRGAIGVCAVALVVYAVLARPRALASALLACGVPTFVAARHAYDAELLATEDPTTPAAIAQGEDLALIVGGCVLAAAVLRLVLIRLDTRLARVQMEPAWRRPLLAGCAGAGVVAVALALLAGVPGEIDQQYDRFVHGNDPGRPGDVRSRLTDAASTGRIDQWRVAQDAFSEEPLRGQGAGTYQTYFARHRPIDGTVTDGHSVYLESLAELGVVGFFFLLVVLGTIIGVLAARSRGRPRATYGVLVAIAIAWALRAGLDWDWEMPAVTIWLFALGGLALAREQRNSSATPGALARYRTVLAVGWLVTALTPGLIAVSQGRLEDGADAFARGDCPAANDRAIAATSVLAVRPEPYAIIGFCDVLLGRGRAAVAAMERAVDLDPDNWEHRFGLALASAAAGMDARPVAAAARRLNPREPLMDDLDSVLRKDDPAARERAARRLVVRAYNSGRLSVDTL